MRQKNNIVPQIESVYSNLTQLEQTIADYFISEPADEDLSAQAVCGRLFISEAISSALDTLDADQLSLESRGASLD